MTVKQRATKIVPKAVVGAVNVGATRLSEKCASNGNPSFGCGLRLNSKSKCVVFGVMF